MDLMRILLCACLAVYGCCDDDPDPATVPHSSSLTSTVPDTDTPDSTETLVSSTVTGISESESPTEQEPASSTTDKDIVYTADPDSTTTGPTTTETEGNYTVYEDHSGEEENLTTTEGSNTSACSSNPCRNGGNCTEDPSSLLFNCSCPVGYAGIRCGIEDRCVVSDEGQLCANGVCVASADGLLRFCRCFQGMYWNETTKGCRDSDPLCLPNPCLNGGTCYATDGEISCACPEGFEGPRNCSVENKCDECRGGTCVLNDRGTTKYCKCPTGMFWNEGAEKCEAISPPCRPDPCENGGICNAFSEADFNCTCVQGYSGPNCEVLDECTSEEDCGGHGSCVLSDDGRTRTCRCGEGYYLDSQSRTCEEVIQPCKPNPCLYDGICTAISQTIFNCTCEMGYSGPTCSVRSLCNQDGGNGFCEGAGARCTDVHELDVFFCTCEDGQYFDYVQRKCLDLDLCPLIHCSPTEECMGGRCECKAHYKWNNNTGKCEPAACDSTPCPAPGMKCEEGSGDADYLCSCPDGHAFNGTHCNEAWCQFPSLNTCSQQCNEMENGYECACGEDFEPKEDNRTCLYVGNATCSNKTCDKGSCVTDEYGEEICVCPAGYTEVQESCVDVCSAGEMTSGMCPMDQCEERAEAGGFRCKCEGKYVLAKDKTTCAVKNVCQKNEVGWKNCAAKNATCVLNWERDEGFHCTCADGKIETAGGICRDVCDLENNVQLCSLKLATCDVDADGNRICKCPPFFKVITGDGVCNKPADYSYLVSLPLDLSAYTSGSPKQRSFDPSSLDYRKITKDVTLMARGMFIGFSQATTLRCSMQDNAIACKFELQFRTKLESSLKRLKIEAMCVTGDDSNRCLLPPSLVLTKDKIAKNVNIQVTDPCDEDIKEEVCGSETTCTSALPSRAFNCTCKPGFEVRRKTYPFGSTKTIVEICRDVNECLEGDPCPPNSNCINTIGSYYCSCKSGYRSVHDTMGEMCLEVCNPNPCTHGKCMRRGDHDFDCKCDAGYRGTFCNLQDKNYKRARINTVIVGVVLGGVLLITLILVAVYISRLRKKKVFDDPGRMLYNSGTEMAERRRVGGGEINNAFQRE